MNVKTRILRVCILLSFWFPGAVMATTLALLGLAVHYAQAGLLALAILNLYLTPLVSYRVFHWFYPIFEGKQTMWPLDPERPSSWIVGHKMQLVFEALPILEHVLVLVPGLYALWLRSWGSKIGADQFFTPQIEATDRGLVELGDRCFFGHRVFLSSHIVTEKDGRFLLYVKRIKIGEGCFVGAMTNFGPGTDIPAKTFVPLASYTVMDDTAPRSSLKV